MGTQLLDPSCRSRPCTSGRRRVPSPMRRRSTASTRPCAWLAPTRSSMESGSSVPRKRRQKRLRTSPKERNRLVPLHETLIFPFPSVLVRWTDYLYALLRQHHPNFFSL